MITLIASEIRGAGMLILALEEIEPDHVQAVIDVLKDKGPDWFNATSLEMFPRSTVKSEMISDLRKATTPAIANALLSGMGKADFSLYTILNNLAKIAHQVPDLKSIARILEVRPQPNADLKHILQNIETRVTSLMPTARG